MKTLATLFIILLLTGCGNHTRTPKCISVGGTSYAYVDETSEVSFSRNEEIRCLSEKEILSRRK